MEHTVVTHNFGHIHRALQLLRRKGCPCTSPVIIIEQLPHWSIIDQSI